MNKAEKQVFEALNVSFHLGLVLGGFGGIAVSVVAVVFWQVMLG